MGVRSQEYWDGRDDAQAEVPSWVGWSYALYCLFWGGLTIGGCGYAVFVRGASGWWFVLAWMFFCSGFKPRRWNQLWRDPA